MDLSIPFFQSELLFYPSLSCVSSLSLTTLISYGVYGTLDWRPIVIFTCSDFLAMGLDHYLDNAENLAQARATGNDGVVSVFTQARMMLICVACILFGALLCSPIQTWAITALFVAPALVWNRPLFWLPIRDVANARGDDEEPAGFFKHGFVIKRIPGMKAIIIGVIRGCGTFAVVHSVLSPRLLNNESSMWTPTQLLIWSTINWICHTTMADVRDYIDDLKEEIPTLPVLFKSVLKTKVLLTFLHAVNIISFSHNVYIVFGSLYATLLVWLLDESSPRSHFVFSMEGQPLTIALYFAVQACKKLPAFA
ncbi:uncharacterized protein FIBRA_05572 [Fibroporia radiculosa]|uniref:UbiA prenyltransferase n=1 Tax=Fibroporia radiculosa TaxID=599839 RepID=J4H3L2_9APHY|nr:uncharacterized protein FIBRA_05572 [Fibroporia radiculosa]CCM03439.1 predicted protein [Fibroporia radiculosa]